jgi:hypothetical protein
MVSTMKVRLIDGRELEGTCEQIVSAMRALSFLHRDATLSEYIAWVVANTLRLNEVRLEVSGATEGELAESLVSEMCANGLAERV